MVGMEDYKKQMEDDTETDLFCRDFHIPGF